MKQIAIYEKKINELLGQIDLEALQNPTMVKVYDQKKYDEVNAKNSSIENKIWQYTKLIKKAKVK